MIFAGVAKGEQSLSHFIHNTNGELNSGASMMNIMACYIYSVRWETFGGGGFCYNTWKLSIT